MDDSSSKSIDGMGRRDLCRLGAAGTFALTGVGSGVGTGAVVGSVESGTNGQVVFIYDDSWREDWTDTFPVHQEEGVPACCAAVPDHIDTSWGLLPEHLREMEDEGWEIMSHSTSHVAVGNLYLTEPAEPEDERLALDGSFLGDYTDDEIVVSDGDRTVENAVAGGGEDEDGIYLELAEPVGESFEAETAFARFDDDRIHEEVVGSKETLEELGVEVDAFVAPFGRSEGLAGDLVRDHYGAFPNGDDSALNALEDIDPYELGRSSIDGESASELDIEAYYNDVADSDALGIVVGHSQFDETTPERVRFAIQAAKDRDLEIVTLREALIDLDVWEGETGGADSEGEAGDDEDGPGPEDERDDETSAETDDAFGATVRENRTPLLAGTGALAALGLAGTAAYRRLTRSDDDGRL
ncbi:Polysaccharide deacetylase [Natronorubrum sediminis]|uniref:Polysaccharide deacetylase n=1 Tax=Natronorubrum sediminis TaxID=640943 RepID=A0A1H6G195_9EURY|nr:polysaccharide deacetylase family protein [Natronorubrum sediminis]SEH16866.1 Polysaccharide deacetylase [Natronorubrum sediminis]